MRNEEEFSERAVRPGLRVAVAVVVGGLIGATGYSLVSLSHERKHASELMAARDETAAALTQTQGQVQALQHQIAELTAAQQQAQEAAPAAGQATESVGRHRARTRRIAARPAVDPRWRRMQTQLDEQQKQIASERDDLAKTRDDLQGKLSATHDELSGSIARTHDELVDLEKRGERNYYEFTLTPSKQFQKVGPIGLALRKANQKHEYFDLAMMVDDYKLDKKHVNLYEPVWINLSDRPQPVELVVNKIDKHQIQGYISEPKYKKSELAANPPAANQPPALQAR